MKRTRWLPVVLILAIVALLYSHVSTAWFCGCDDFNEVNRAVFIDSPNPVNIFRTAHNVSYLYRPMTSGLQYVTWSAFHSSIAFRIRNLLMHLVSVTMLYGIVMLLLGSREVAIGSALLFGLEPLANETVAVAVWANATAYALVFVSLYLFLYSLHEVRQKLKSRLALGLSLLCMLLALFTYEPTVTGYALMLLYLYLRKVRGEEIPRWYAATVLAAFAAELAFFFLARHFIVTGVAAINSPIIVVRNAVMYGVALVLPVDFVMAHLLIGTPFPSELKVNAHVAVAMGLACAALLIAAWTLLRRFRVCARLSANEADAAKFCAIGIPLGVLPLLVFRDHPSEHDLYLSAAFYVVLLCLLFRRFSSSALAYASIVSLFAVSFGISIVLRNGEVERCASIARAIVTQLPVDRWRTGGWSIRLADSPRDAARTPYAVYNDRGLMTLELQQSEIHGAEQALQLAAHNPEVRVRVVDNRAMQSGCTRPYTCFWVSENGNVTPVGRVGLKY